MNEIRNLLLFRIKGKLIHSAISFLGKWYVLTVSHKPGLIFLPLYIDKKEPFKIFAIRCDFSFTAKQDVDNAMVRARKTHSQYDMISFEMVSVDIILQYLLSSKRQLAECGVKSFKIGLRLFQFPLSRDSQ